MKKIFTTALLVLFLSPVIWSTTENKHINTNALFYEETLSRSGPHYSYLLLESGEQIFIGKFHTKIGGADFEIVPKGKFSKLKKFLTDNIFSDYPESLECKAWSSAEGKTIFLLYDNGLMKRLEHSHWCNGFEGEKRLYELEKKFEELLDLGNYLNFDRTKHTDYKFYNEVAEQNVFIYRRKGSYKVFIFESGLQIFMKEATTEDKFANYTTDIFINKVPKKRYKKLIELLNKHKFSEFIDFDTLMDVAWDKTPYNDEIAETEEYKPQEEFVIDYFHQYEGKIKEVMHDSDRFYSKHYKYEDEMYRLEAEIEELLDVKGVLKTQ